MNVAEYYDENTKRFLKSGSGSGEDAIHRPVWGKGVSNRSQAVHFVEDEILRRITALHAKSILDLGCGVGGTMLHMRDRYPAEFRGVTISGVQHRIGGEKLSAFTDCKILHGDMTDPGLLAKARDSLPSPAAAYCIESFLHVPDGLEFLKTLGSILQPGDLFVLCDDFRSAAPNTPKSGRVLAAFSDGWHAPSLYSVDAVISAAGAGGLKMIEDRDLTPGLKLMGVQNIAIRILVSLLRPFGIRSAWWDNFRGGDALQKALSWGLTTYRLITFSKGDS